jgi:hypothetical protein
MTAQVADRILIDGRECALFSEPLREYLVGAKIRFTAPNTALWRGYIARWEVSNGRLFLLAFWGTVCTVHVNDAARVAECQRRHEGPCVGREMDLDGLFPGSKGRVFAEWVTGRLKIPKGKLLKYVHMGFESVYENYLTLDVDRGVVRNTTVEKTRKPAKWWMFWHNAR